jgi:hypothetical protein
VTSYSPAALPSTTLPTSLVAALYRDLVLDASAWVRYRTLDLDADTIADAFVMTWHNVKLYGTTTRATFQVILRASGEIVCQYASYTGANHAYTIGLQDEARTTAAQYFYGPSTAASGPVTAGLAVRFRPQSTSWLSAAPSPLALGAFGAGTLTVSADAALAVGTHTETLRLLTTSSEQPTLETPVTCVVLPNTPRHAWQLAHFTAAQMADAGVSGPFADPDYDGLRNELERALALDPLAPSALAAPARETDADGTWLAWTYRRSTRATDLALALQQTPDLASAFADVFFDGVNATQQVVHPDPDGDGAAQLVKARVKCLPGQHRMFLRLEAR